MIENRKYTRRTSQPRITNITWNLFLEITNQLYNGFYDYSETDIFNKIDGQIKIICPKHGEFWKLLTRHLSDYHRQGCPKCGIEKCGAKGVPRPKENSLSIFLEEAKKIYNGYYDYSLISLDTVYINNTRNLPVICPEHGIFYTSGRHVSGSKPIGCPECGKLKTIRAHSYSEEQWFEKFLVAHGSKYKYGQFVYVNGKIEKIEVFCPGHGLFLQAVGVHSTGHGCPTCGLKISNKELEWLDFMEVPRSSKNRQVRVNLEDGSYFFVDGYLSESNTVYEFWGDYYHGNPLVFDPTGINEKVGISFGDLYEQTFEQNRKNYESRF